MLISLQANLQILQKKVYVSSVIFNDQPIEPVNDYPMAKRVSPQATMEEAEADNKEEALHSRTLCSPLRDAAMPTSPARSEKITKNPVARFPMG